MFIRQAKALGLAAIMAAALSGTAFAAQDTLVIAKAEDPPTADPGVEISNNGFTLIFAAYEHLVKYDGGTTNVIGELADSWTVNDAGTEWTFKLKDGHAFDDGSPVDAAAIKFTFDRLKGLAAGPNDSFPTLQDVQVVDPLTVKFVLSAPFAPFLSTLAVAGAAIVNPKVMAHEVDGDWAKGWLAEHSAGSGAYVLTSWERNQQIVMDANPHYGGAEPALKHVIFKIIREVSSRRLQLENGDVDLIETLPVDQAEAMQGAPGVVIESNPSLYVIYVYMNNKKPPLDDVRVRQAISYAMDYQGLVDGVFQGQAEQMRGAIPDGMWGHDPEGFQFTYDLDKAKALLDEAGVSDLHLTFTYSNADVGWEPAGIALQAALAEIGVTLDLQNVADTTKRQMVVNGETDLATGAWTPDYADPFIFMNLWYDPDRFGGPGNRAFYENPEVTALIREAASITDQEKRTQLYIDAQKIATMDAPYILLLQKNDLFAMRDTVKGYVYNPMLLQIYNLEEMSKTQ